MPQLIAGNWKMHCMASEAWRWRRGSRLEQAGSLPKCWFAQQLCTLRR